MNKYNYVLSSAWAGPAQDAATVGEKFLQSLDALGKVDSSLSDWGTKLEGSDLGQPIAKLRNEDFTAFVETPEEPNEFFDPPDDGYILFAANGFGEGPYRTAKSVRFDLHAGSAFQNHYDLEVGSHEFPPAAEEVTFPLFKGALLTLIRIWPAPWANVRVSLWGGNAPPLPDGSPFPYSGYQMPWLSYLCAERAAKVDSPSELLTERTPDGGLLMIAAETRLDPDNPQHLIRSKMLAEIMIAHGGDPAW
jgi:hypothetical protein